jgi:hypothetical protein
MGKIVREMVRSKGYMGFDVLEVSHLSKKTDSYMNESSVRD